MEYWSTDPGNLSLHLYHALYYTGKSLCQATLNLPYSSSGSAPCGDAFPCSEKIGHMHYVFTIYRTALWGRF